MDKWVVVLVGLVLWYGAMGLVILAYKLVSRYLHPVCADCQCRLVAKPNPIPVSKSEELDAFLKSSPLPPRPQWPLPHDHRFPHGHKSDGVTCDRCGEFDEGSPLAVRRRASEVGNEL